MLAVQPPARRAREATSVRSTSPLLGVNDLQARLALSGPRLPLSDAKRARTSQPQEAESPGAKLPHSPAPDWVKEKLLDTAEPREPAARGKQGESVCGCPGVCICVCHREMEGETSALGHLRAYGLG